MENRQYFIRHVCMRRARLRAVDQGDPAKIAGTLNYSGAITLIARLTAALGLWVLLTCRGSTRSCMLLKPWSRGRSAMNGAVLPSTSAMGIVESGVGP
jgi:hypothetical protein